MEEDITKLTNVELEERCKKLNEERDKLRIERDKYESEIGRRVREEKYKKYKKYEGKYYVKKDLHFEIYLYIIKVNGDHATYISVVYDNIVHNNCNINWHEDSIRLFAPAKLSLLNINYPMSIEEYEEITKEEFEKAKKEVLRKINL